MFLKILQKSQESTCVNSFIKKEIPAQMLSRKLCKIYFAEHIFCRTPANSRFWEITGQKTLGYSFVFLFEIFYFKDLWIARKPLKLLNFRNIYLSENSVCDRTSIWNILKFWQTISTFLNSQLQCCLTFS